MSAAGAVRRRPYFAREVADRVIFMDGGVVVEEGPPSEVLAAPRQERTRQFVQRLLDH